MNKIALICDKEEYALKITNTFQKSTTLSRLDVQHFTKMTAKEFHMYFVYVSCADDFRVVQQIENHFPFAMIVIFSDQDELVYQAWEYPVLFFLRMNMLEEDLKRLLKKVVIVEKNTRYMYHYKGELHPIRYKDILYFSVLKNMLTIHFVDSTTIEERKTVKSLMQELSPFVFMQISQSLVVNKAKIRTIDKDQVILENGEGLFVTRTYRNVLRDLSMNDEEQTLSESTE